MRDEDDTALSVEATTAVADLLLSGSLERLHYEGRETDLVPQLSVLFSSWMQSQQLPWTRTERGPIEGQPVRLQADEP
eukprot:1627640-Prymnesium_polylepis.1